MDGQADGRMDGQADGRMDGWNGRADVQPTNGSAGPCRTVFETRPQTHGMTSTATLHVDRPPTASERIPERG